MKKRISISIFLFLLFGLANCTSTKGTPYPKDTPNGVQQTTSTVTATPISSLATAVPTASPMVTDTAAPSTLSPSPTATIMSVKEVARNCLNVLPSLPEQKEYQGKLILSDFSDNLNYLYDLRTTHKTKMAGTGVASIAVAPDRKRYDLYDFNSPYLQIFSSTGSLQRSIPWEKDWLGLGQWLDDDRVIIRIPMFATNSNGWLNVEHPEPLLLLDITTMQRQKLLPDYPNIEQVYFRTEWGSGTTVYDASLSRVIYLAGSETDPFAFYILWDIPNKKKLAELPTVNINEPPFWSPDWSRFIVDANTTIYMVTRDGAIDKITNDEFDASAFSWSHDGRYVAFWLKVQTSYTLIVLDTQTAKMVDYCIQAVPNDDSNHYPLITPIWSPDRNAFVIAGILSESQPERDVILIDLEKGIAAKITTGSMPFGWLATP
jgi:hypothetical protein